MAPLHVVDQRLPKQHILNQSARNKWLKENTFQTDQTLLVHWKQSNRSCLILKWCLQHSWSLQSLHAQLLDQTCKVPEDLTVIKELITAVNIKLHSRYALLIYWNASMFLSVPYTYCIPCLYTKPLQWIKDKHVLWNFLLKIQGPTIYTSQLLNLAWRLGPYYPKRPLMTPFPGWLQSWLKLLFWSK